ncbi:MAG: HPF/RaiA family ribosome-associated protein [Azonexus sp.]|nr:HPF/RaiA family ribosome-associated protein [Azonexus sp.]
MQIELRANGIEVSESLRDHTERCLNFGLDWAKQDVDRIVITLSDINGPRGGNDKRCQLRIPLPRMRDVVIEEVASDLQVAIARSVDRAARSLERRLSRQREFGPIPVSPVED